MGFELPKREKFSVETVINGETIEKIYSVQMKPLSMAEFMALSEEEKGKGTARPYPFEQRKYEAAPGIICEQDVAVPMRDGVELYCDIFRPASSYREDAAQIPAILSWSNYGKRPNEYREGADIGFTPGVPIGAVSPMAKFEAVDPAYWCPQDYAVINIDVRGIGYSGGYNEQFCKQEGEDGYDFIEWVAAQDWCNGKVTMAGSSALAMAQWYIAAEQPPHLACIAPWEGQSDLYRESLYEGGIPMIMFTEFATAGSCGLNGVDDQGAMARKYPMMNAYWQSKIPDFEKIVVPAYICAGWNHFHLRGTLNAWQKIGSQQKWLRAHREFEWPDFYTPDNIEELKLFFDRYCKNIYNGWELTPRVRIDVQDAYDQDFVTARAENEFPLARTQYKKLYLDAANQSLSFDEAKGEATLSYDGVEGESYFDITFARDIEISGYMKLHAYVEADGHDDMDMFFTVKKFSPEGVEMPLTVFNGTAPHPGAYGKMRVSHRELDPALSSDFQPVMSHRREQKLSPGEIAEIDVEFYPTSRIWHAGETLRLHIAGRYIRDPHWIEPLIYEPSNHGKHIIHTGEIHPSYLQIPVIGPRYDTAKPFVVDAAKHPSHPIF